jgi:hypothetical protein
MNSRLSISISFMTGFLNSMGRIYGCGSVFAIDATVNSETFKHSQFVT